MCDGVQQQQRAAAAASHISTSNRLRSELYLYVVGTTTILRGDVTEAGIILGMSIIPEPCLLRSVAVRLCRRWPRFGGTDTVFPTIRIAVHTRTVISCYHHLVLPRDDVGRVA
jgi:hypothetical protein